MKANRKSIAALVANASGLKFKKTIPVNTNTLQTKGKVKLGLNDAAKAAVVERIADGARREIVAREFGISVEMVDYIKNAKERVRIGESDGAMILRKSLLENAIIAGEVVRGGIGELDAAKAAVVQGISTSNYLALKAKTETEQIAVSPHEIKSLALTIAGFRKRADLAPRSDVEAKPFELGTAREILPTVIEVSVSKSLPDK